ncbi:MAG: ABC transporter ATP-binding protein [Cellvibrionaceae bacterium]|nr:ABC transporter ATP-binding protein [Cellvibrionaceae bacterium]
MLKIENMAVDYGANRVIDQLNLNLANDEILMMVGPTGCGKSTILQAVAGLLPLAQGSVSLGKWRASRKKQVAPEQRNIGMVFQDFALFPHLTVEQNASFRLKDTRAADQWLDMLGLEPLRKAKPEQLSGGQKQRVALARALAHGPALMLLDEPLSSLDAALKDKLRWEIRNALKAAGVPAIWVTHDQHEALSIGDRLGILRAGKLQQIDTPEQCFCAPANRFVAGFLGEVSFLAAQLNGDRAETAVGSLPAKAAEGVAGEAELMVRPDDCGIKPALGEGHGRIEKAQYEGGTWLYKLRLNDGSKLLLRVNHEQRFALGDRVEVVPTTRQPLLAFAPQ